MPFKCSVFGCKFNYDKKEESNDDNGENDDQRLKLFRFPDDDNEKEMWIKLLPNADFEWKESKRVCEKHWLPGYPTKVINRNGAVRPAIPPSVFPGVPPSCVPTQPPKKRKTASSRRSSLELECTSSTSTKAQDEEFLPAGELQEDTRYEILSYDHVYSLLLQHFSEDCVTKNENRILLTSQDYDGPVANYTVWIIKTDTDGQYEVNAYKGLINMKFPFLSIGKAVSSWAEIELSINYTKNYDKDNDSNIAEKEQFLSRQIVLLNKRRNEQFSQEDLCLALSLYAKSRSAYMDLLKFVNLPSTRTLRRVTNKVDNTTDDEYLRGITNGLTPEQMNCFLLLDEVYVKPGYQYTGMVLHGGAVDNPNVKARTVLALMVNFLFGGPKLVFKIYPVHKLNSDFMVKHIFEVLGKLEEANITVKGIIVDNNRVNQNCLKSMADNAEIPYVMSRNEKNMYLFKDTTHILKCIRNNWITEPSKEFEYQLPNESKTRTAKWKYIEELYKKSANDIVRVDRLTYSAVYPRPIERQSVKLVLKVFSESTIAALKVTFGDEAEDTVLFLEFVLKWWIVVNTKSAYGDITTRDVRRAPIRSPDDWQLKFLADEVPKFATFLRKPTGGKRKKKLTMDTADALKFTSIALSKYATDMLESHDYVLLGQVTTDPLEKQFGKYRQSAGTGTYLITVKNIEQRFRLDKARKYVQSAATLELPKTGHVCSLCNIQIDLDFDEIVESESELATSVRQGLVYIAGYVTHQLPALSEALEEEDTNEQYNKFGQLIDEQNRGKLKAPKDSIVYFAYYCYMAFVLQQDIQPTCQKNYIDYFMEIIKFSDMLQKNKKKACRILSNVFLNNWTKRKNENSNKKGDMLKVAKLSV